MVKKDKISLDYFGLHAVKNNISHSFHKLNSSAFLKIPLSFFVKNVGKKGLKMLADPFIMACFFYKT